jgi:hypothetical protein
MTLSIKKLNIMTLSTISVAFSVVVLSASRLSIVILSVVAPFVTIILKISLK